MVQLKPSTQDERNRMTTEFPLNESTKDDIIDLVALRLRRAYEDGETRTAEAITLWAQQEKLADIISLYVSVFELEVSESRHDEFHRIRGLTTSDQFAKDAARRIVQRKVPRPANVTASFFAYHQDVNDSIATAVADAIHEIYKYNSEAAEWEGDVVVTKVAEMKARLGKTSP